MAADVEDGQPTSTQRRPLRWWVYDLPFRRDPLFWLAMVVFAWWATDQWFDWQSLPPRTRANTDLATRLLSIFLGGSIAFAAAVLAVGTVAGSVREFWRGLRGR